MKFACRATLILVGETGLEDLDVFVSETGLEVVYVLGHTHSAIRENVSLSPG